MSHRAAAAEAFPDSVARLRAALVADPRVVAALGTLDWAMRLPSRSAPGYVYLAGARRGAPVGGGGGDAGSAAARLAGEASEAVAQENPAGRTDLRIAAGLAAAWGDGPCLAAVSLTQSRQVGAPMSAIFPAIAGPPDAPPRSLGLAAGADAPAAWLAGLLELVERDAAAAWWSGAVRARAVCAAVAAPAATGLAAMRAGADAPWRPTTLLALPGAAGVPVACALSCDADGRGGLAFGLKAALDPSEAASGAVRELLQMEIALEIARMRAGRSQPAPGDRGVLRRAALDPGGFAAFAPLPPWAAGPPPRDLDDLVGRLARGGVEVIVADLASQPGGLAVAKVFAPGLQPLPGPGAPPQPGAPGAVVDLM